MSAEQYLREGKLADALGELQKRVKANPSDAKERLFLFQLLAVLGQWDRAAVQIKTAAQLDASLLILTQLCGLALAAEGVREKAFAGTETPVLMGEPSAWSASLLEALRLSGGGHHEAAAKARDDALALAPTRAGTINGTAFEWFADMDSRIGPCAELIVDGKYLWAPFERIQSLTVEEPTDLRDVVWIQAIVTWTNGGQSPALMPTRYPLTQRDDDALRLARRTEWHEPIPASYFGSGQRMFATDAGEYPLLELRELRFETGASG